MTDFYTHGRGMSIHMMKKLTQINTLLYNWRKTLLVLVFVCFQFVCLAQEPQGNGTLEANDTIKPLEIKDEIPDELWTTPLKVINHPEGKEFITLSDYKEKLIILDFWASWCIPCIKSITKIEDYLLDKNLAESAILIPVLVHDTPERGLNYISEHKKHLWSIDDTNFKLKNWFSNYITGFGVTLIYDKQWIAAPIPKNVTVNNLQSQVNGENVNWVNIKKNGGQND